MGKILILLSLFASGCKMNHNDGIRSHVSIIESIDPASIKADQGLFFHAKIDLINETDSILNFWTMSCSWQENWIFEDQKLRFFIYCPKNTPKLLHLKPGNRITYDGIIEIVDTVNCNLRKKYRLGFVLIMKGEVNKDADFDRVLYDKIDTKKDIIWSEPFVFNKRSATGSLL
jgi:hypothetical protein